ncbi:16S rRNA (cytidine(1402)-2'-O)-methyltransferase [Candidatus Vesicomyidisocius sp. SY067_SCS001]|uniref:16S rRNA (cytidine(1402)-2'-O)-methyltransferase n=1 Tax=Candidatus Vesicomyidisocius sp. SY067_SCS001 TaxID=2732590 RepID=UPI001685F331|nr:16S rRNA (cytidine(1402)-2'-O)-methyltransferase [Candidatus Vesicomyosocius sp. SY067_SCS001]
MNGTLYIIATPIGNLNDITFRAIKTLKTVDIILAEDICHSKHLLNHYDIKTPMHTFHEHNEICKTPDVINKLLEGKHIALISDAGTPLISDPGHVLVIEAKKVGINVSPIPGSNAMISAISVSGIASNKFSFFGFLPSKQSARLKVIQSIVNINEMAIFYESPNRILSCAQDLQAVLGDERIVCFAKELTKLFETIKTNTLPQLIDYLQADHTHQKGEFVILISAVKKNNKVSGEEMLNKVLPILLIEMGTAKAARLVAKMTGFDKRYCYQRAIEFKYPL